MKPIMIVGTASDVGKSLVVTGICRWLKQQGHTPAPFKAQNMSLNSYATPEGLEIGRAQAVQAEACEIACHTDMNPILLKPSSDKSSQIVLHGKPVGNQSAKSYFLGDNKARLFEEAKNAFKALSARYSPIVMEGAGSISELNLKHRDIVNMRMAEAADACVYLVADIDKGGVFASVYGTVALLEDWEKALLKGIIINKFRGDITLFEPGRKKIEELTGYPVLGVLPYDLGLYLEEEDSVALATKQTEWQPGQFNVAVLRFRYMANYTDFDALSHQPGINVYYTREPEALKKADVVVLPGTKSTMADLKALYDDRLVEVITHCYHHKKVVGICGGYQMMGKRIFDPNQVESTTESMDGLGLFDIETTLAQEKRTVQQQFQFKGYPTPCEGYEIHMGETEIHSGQPLNQAKDGHTEGYLAPNGAWGTYFHGIFDNATVVADLLGVAPNDTNTLDYRQFKQDNYDRLAGMISQNLDMEQILKDTTVK